MYNHKAVRLLTSINDVSTLLWQFSFCCSAGINIFVAFFLLLLLMEANLPPAAAKVPLLGKPMLKILYWEGEG